MQFSLIEQLGDRQLAGPGDGNEQVELALSGPHLGDIHVEDADGVALEALTLWLAVLNVRQAGDAMPLETPMQR